MKWLARRQASPGNASWEVGAVRPAHFVACFQSRVSPREYSRFCINIHEWRVPSSPRLVSPHRTLASKYFSIHILNSCHKIVSLLYSVCRLMAPSACPLPFEPVQRAAEERERRSTCSPVCIIINNVGRKKRSVVRHVLWEAKSNKFRCRESFPLGWLTLFSMHLTQDYFPPRIMETYIVLAAQRSAYSSVLFKAPFSGFRSQ